MGGPCATGSSTENSGAAGTNSGSITTGSPTDSTNAGVSATGSGVGASNTGVAGSNATGVQTGSVAIGVQTGSGAAGSLQTGVSAMTGSSFEAAGISSTLSTTWVDSSMTVGSPTELNSATSVIGAERLSTTGSSKIGSDFFGSGMTSATDSMTGVSTGSTFGVGASTDVRGTKFSTAGPTVVVPPFAPKGRLGLLNGTAARRTEGSEAFRCNETCGGPPARRFGAAIFSTAGSDSIASKLGPLAGAGER